MVKAQCNLGGKATSPTLTGTGDALLEERLAVGCCGMCWPVEEWAGGKLIPGRLTSSHKKAKEQDCVFVGRVGGQVGTNNRS